MIPFHLFTTCRYWFLIPLLAVHSCGEPDNPPERTTPASEVSISSSEQSSVNYADGFQIRYYDGYKRIDILNPYQDQTDTLSYVLIPRGEQPPRLDYDAQVIEVPVRSMIVTSTTHLALTDMLNENSVITGIAQPGYVYNETIRQRLNDGDIESFTGGELNKEQALALDPDLIMVSGGQVSQFDNFRVLMDSGIEVAVNSEWLEQTPLGKAEWVKMMGALLNKETMANQKFEQVLARYEELKQKAEGVLEKPLVINNSPYQGAWFVSGGNSFTAQFLKDAGADYPWFYNPSTGGLRMDFETVYEVGIRADVWLNPGSAESREDLLAADSRFQDFKSFQNGQIYNNNRRMSPTGGNDYWESGVVHPEIVLADLIKILHPELLPDYELYYYQRLD